MNETIDEKIKARVRGFIGVCVAIIPDLIKSGLDNIKS